MFRNNIRFAKKNAKVQKHFYTSEKYEQSLINIRKRPTESQNSGGNSCSNEVLLDRALSAAKKAALFEIGLFFIRILFYLFGTIFYIARWYYPDPSLYGSMFIN